MLVHNFPKRLKCFLVKRVVTIQSLSLDMHKLTAYKPLEIVGNGALFIGQLFGKFRNVHWPIAQSMDNLKPRPVAECMEKCFVW